MAERCHGKLQKQGEKTTLEIRACLHCLHNAKEIICVESNPPCHDAKVAFWSTNSSPDCLALCCLDNKLVPQSPLQDLERYLLCARYVGAMRQRKLGSHTPPCHRRMVITTLFSVLLAALQRRPVLYHTRWLLTVHRHWSSGHLGQLAPTTHPQCRLVSNPCPAGRDPVMHLLSGS